MTTSCDVAMSLLSDNVQSDVNDRWQNKTKDINDYPAKSSPACAATEEAERGTVIMLSQSPSNKQRLEPILLTDQEQPMVYASLKSKQECDSYFAQTSR